MIALKTRGNSYAYRFASVLEGVALTFTFRWSPRGAAWYADVHTADGVAICEGIRVTPGSPIIPDTTRAGLPPGVVFVQGSDPYERSSFGDRVEVFYATAAEIA